jgi:hypothetical protein
MIAAAQHTYAARASRPQLLRVLDIQETAGETPAV